MRFVAFTMAESLLTGLVCFSLCCGLYNFVCGICKWKPKTTKNQILLFKNLCFFPTLMLMRDNKMSQAIKTRAYISSRELPKVSTFLDVFNAPSTTPFMATPSEGSKDSVSRVPSTSAFNTSSAMLTYSPVSEFSTVQFSSPRLTWCWVLSTSGPRHSN